MKRSRERWLQRHATTATTPGVAHERHLRVLLQFKLYFPPLQRHKITMAETYHVTTSTENKWSKNGFGESVSRDQAGKFTREESETVRRAIEDFCAQKQISTARLCSECDHKAELKGAWMEISKSIPHRSVQSVYRHGLRQLHPFKRGPVRRSAPGKWHCAPNSDSYSNFVIFRSFQWTDEEVASLHELVARMGKKWSAIQGKLNRSADSCRDKYREMSNEYTKG